MIPCHNRACFKIVENEAQYCEECQKKVDAGAPRDEYYGYVLQWHPEIGEWLSPFSSAFSS